MRYILIISLFVASSAWGLDVCHPYKGVHQTIIEPRIRSGIPFKLLSIATDKDHTFRRIVRIDYDLWSEKVGVEVLGGSKIKCSLKESMAVICEALSFEDLKQSGPFKFQLLLNPDLTNGLDRLHAKGIKRVGFLEINWRRLSQELNAEKLLIDSEIFP